MGISNYTCYVLGEEPETVRRYHPSTFKRMKAFAIAIHIPVMLWAITGYAISSQVFGLDHTTAATAAVFCAILIYMVERLVLATPKSWYVTVGRLFIGVVIAVLGASIVDLVIFDREVSQSIRVAEEVKLNEEYKSLIEDQKRVVAQSKAEWFKAQEAANCEANGTCGSKIRNAGPVYRELARHAEILRKQFGKAETKLDELETAKAQAMAEVHSSPKAIEQAGLLARFEALHQYTIENKVAFVAWLLFGILVLFFELLVVLVKLVFVETVDDKIDMIREQISHYKASAFMEATTSPVAGARMLLDLSDC